MRQPLIDADVALYETGFAVETAWGENEGYPPFEWAALHFDNLINNICVMVEATDPPILFLTGKTNFRYAIAKRTPYKERVGKKPFHYNNLKAYIKGKYDYRISEGDEADDEMSIEQTLRPNDVIVCSRDKDTFSTEGWHYGWECGRQPAFGPLWVTELGFLEYDAVKKTIRGVGSLFFYAQCLMGDTVDSVPGVPKYGKKKAYDLLFDADCIQTAYLRVMSVYETAFGERAAEELLEQARLLYMVRVQNGRKLLFWNPPDSPYEDWYDIDTREIERISRV